MSEIIETTVEVDGIVVTVRRADPNAPLDGSGFPIEGQYTPINVIPPDAVSIGEPFPVEVEYDFDPNTDGYNYTTFFWAPVTDPSRRVRCRPPFPQRIEVDPETNRQIHGVRISYGNVGDLVKIIAYSNGVYRESDIDVELR